MGTVAGFRAQCSMAEFWLGLPVELGDEGGRLRATTVPTALFYEALMKTAEIQGTNE